MYASKGKQKREPRICCAQAHLSKLYRLKPPQILVLVNNLGILHAFPVGNVYVTPSVILEFSSCRGAFARSQEGIQRDPAVPCTHKTQGVHEADQMNCPGSTTVSRATNLASRPAFRPGSAPQHRHYGHLTNHPHFSFFFFFLTGEYLESMGDHLLWSLLLLLDQPKTPKFVRVTPLKLVTLLWTSCFLHLQKMREIMLGEQMTIE